MTLDNLVAELKASLQSSAKFFTESSDGAFKRHLDVAARAMALKRPRTLGGTITLQADVAEYSGVPSDLVAFKSTPWGHMNSTRRTPWQYRQVMPLPVVTVGAGDAGRVFRFTPAPTSDQISVFGATFSYYYFGSHVLSNVAGETTVLEQDSRLLLLRAQAEAMRELAILNNDRPADLRGGSISGSKPKNSTPSAIYQAFLAEFETAP